MFFRLVTDVVNQIALMWSRKSEQEPLTNAFGFNNLFGGGKSKKAKTPSEEDSEEDDRGRKGPAGFAGKLLGGIMKMPTAVAGSVAKHAFKSFF
ncbi:hypothetical protein GCK32_005448 [Trichostrongylus colubriformis]|uniref:Uncharacterized protein n=1 Tax=Trichostrongylus colubriformis TaxID=6319 RepID=A0AAN8IPM0_TRICO